MIELWQITTFKRNPLYIWFFETFEKKMTFSQYLTKKDHSYMEESIFATWVATALLSCVIGANFSTRESVESSTRHDLEILFVSLGIAIMIWASLSFLNILSFRFHRIVLVLIMMLIVGSFAYTVFLISDDV
jgi:hypothetical protein